MTTAPHEPTDALQAMAMAHRGDELPTLALRLSGMADADRRYVLDQVSGWQVARRKLPAWAAVDTLRYPPHLALEQCSSEATARHKATVVSRIGTGGRAATMVDLTGGFGVDCYHVGRLFSHVTYVEKQAELSAIVRANYHTLGADHIDIVVDDAVAHLRSMPAADWIIVDPARRDGHGGRTVALADCTPDVTRLLPLLRSKAAHTLLKLSPMIDLSEVLAQLPGTVEIDVVAVEGECKEVIATVEGGSRQLSGEEVPIACVNLPAEGPTPHAFVFTRGEEAAAPATAAAPTVGNHLYEPHAALMKAGAFRCLSERLGVRPIGPNSHLYTSSTRRADFPGRTFTIVDIYGSGKSDVRRLRQTIKRANVAVRNYPTSAVELRRRLGLQDGGDIYLFGTTDAQGRHIIVECRKDDG